MAAGASSVLGDAITTLSKATLAIAAAEDQARRDVSKAASDADVFRRERDAARNALSASQKEAHAHKLDAEGWKSKADQANLALKHARELAEGVRREADQWKDQFTRLEKTRASQEESLLAQIDEWRDQCRRVEKERSRLSTKLEEMMLRQTRIQPPPYTPQHTHHDNSIPSSSATTKVAKSRPSQSYADTQRSMTAVEESDNVRRKAPRSTPVRVRQRPRTIDDAEDEEVHPAKSSRPRTQSARRSVLTEPVETQLIRRVHAVISVPVKEEEREPRGVESAGLFDSGYAESARSRSVSRGSARRLLGHTSQTKSGRHVRPAPNRLSRNGEYAGDDYEEDEYENNHKTRADDGDNDRDDDYDDHEHTHGRKKPRREPDTRTRRKSLVVEENSEEDDELMIGAEEDHDAVYGSSRITKRTVSPVKTSHRPKERSLMASGAKRKNPPTAVPGDRSTVHKAKR